jgi:hypothetical protein
MITKEYFYLDHECALFASWSDAFHKNAECRPPTYYLASFQRFLGRDYQGLKSMARVAKTGFPHLFAK